jgi:hypothetical protein
LLFEIAEKSGESLLKYSIFAKNIEENCIGRVICFGNNAEWVYEGQLLKKQPHGFGRKIYFENSQVIGLVGNFEEGKPSGKIIKFFINPIDKKVQILDQGVMSNWELQEQKIVF